MDDRQHTHKRRMNMPHRATFLIRLMLWGMAMCLLVLALASAVLHLSQFILHGLTEQLADRISAAVGHIEATFKRYGFGGVR